MQAKLMESAAAHNVHVPISLRSGLSPDRASEVGALNDSAYAGSESNLEHFLHKEVSWRCVFELKGPLNDEYDAALGRWNTVFLATLLWSGVMCPLYLCTGFEPTAWLLFFEFVVDMVFLIDALVLLAWLNMAYQPDGLVELQQLFDSQADSQGRLLILKLATEACFTFGTVFFGSVPWGLFAMCMHSKSAVSNSLRCTRMLRVGTLLMSDTSITERTGNFGSGQAPHSHLGPLPLRPTPT